MTTKRAAKFVTWDGVEFAVPRGPSRVRVYSAVDLLLLIGIAAWFVVDAASRHPIYAVVGGIFFFEVTLVRLAMVARAGGVCFEPSSATRVAVPLNELCGRVGCDVPRVVMRDDAVRVAGVRQVRKRVVLVVSNEFVEQVDDRQLRAILAHEVTHVARSDFRWGKARGLLALAVAIAAAIALSVGVTGTFKLSWYVAGLLIAWIIANGIFGALNRPLERRADLEGAQLAGDPAALAHALSLAHQFSETARRKLYGPRPWRWLIFPLSVPVPTHPAMGARIRAMEDLAGPAR